MIRIPAQHNVENPPGVAHPTNQDKPLSYMIDDYKRCAKEEVGPDLFVGDVGEDCMIECGGCQSHYLTKESSCPVCNKPFIYPEGASW